LYCEAKLYHGLFGLTEAGCNVCTRATTEMLILLPFLAATIHAGAVQILLNFYSGFISISVSKPKSYLGVKKVFNNKLLHRNLLFMQYNA